MAREFISLLSDVSLLTGSLGEYGEISASNQKMSFFLSTVPSEQVTSYLEYFNVSTYTIDELLNIEDVESLRESIKGFANYLRRL